MTITKLAASLVLTCVVGACTKVSKNEVAIRDAILRVGSNQCVAFKAGSAIHHELEMLYDSYNDKWSFDYSATCSDGSCISVSGFAYTDHEIYIPYRSYVASRKTK